MRRVRGMAGSLVLLILDVPQTKGGAELQAGGSLSICCHCSDARKGVQDGNFFFILQNFTRPTRCFIKLCLHCCANVFAFCLNMAALMFTSPGANMSVVQGAAKADRPPWFRHPTSTLR